jgi:anti-sigma B factor antagonist
MKIDTTQEGNITLVTLEGVIALGESAREFSRYLQELLETQSTSVLIDLSGIDHVDSTGLGELVGYLQRFSEQGRRLALLQPPQRILNLLKLTKLDEVFSIFDDRSAALSEMND